MVGNVPVGGDAPVTVQTMTNTLTSDPVATIAQIRRAELAGVDIVRVSCPDEASTAALAEIVREVNVPVVADIHFHYKRAIEAAPLLDHRLHRRGPGGGGRGRCRRGARQQFVRGLRPRVVICGAWHNGSACSCPESSPYAAAPK